MICPAASAAVANSGIKTTARATAIIGLRMRLSSLPWGALEDDSSPLNLSTQITLAGAGAERNPGELLCERSLSTPFAGVRGRLIFRTSPDTVLRTWRFLDRGPAPCYAPHNVSTDIGVCIVSQDRCDL